MSCNLRFLSLDYYKKVNERIGKDLPSLFLSVLEDDGYAKEAVKEIRHSVLRKMLVDVSEEIFDWNLITREFTNEILEYLEAHGTWPSIQISIVPHGD